MSKVKCRLLVSLLVLTILSFLSLTETATAQSFPIVGSWLSGYSGLSFNQDGLFQGFANVPPQMNNGVGGRMVWNGRYKLISNTSWTAQIDAFQFCALGGCSNCPRGNNDDTRFDACVIAQSAGLVVGQMSTRAFRPNGPNQFADQFGQTWQRAGTVAPTPAPMPGGGGGGYISPMAPCSTPGQTFCPSSGWLLRCDGQHWLTGSERC